ncbi:MAG TPA: single-stranded-DNA-specific exonuclease RecJ [Geopsychrobacteraceae bacterium]|nr:single-stranded-DNA-specific exonuclease RecJ [Geopsychrobacteraceae bacterium]
MKRQKIWQLRGENPAADQLQKIALGLDVDHLTARALLFRGINSVAAGREFLEARLQSLPDPDLLPDMAIATGRIEQALRDGEKIAVHGDYDVDGISGCSLLVESLRLLGGEVEYHIPLRLTEGYGLSADAIRKAFDNGCRVLISVDCGVSAVDEADLASELGLDLIITDHHQPSEHLPVCLALINPHLPGNRFPWADLSGVGVAFFMLAGLRRRLRESSYFTMSQEPDLRQVLDLVALGTIADIVPLGGVNRILVRAGLDRLEHSSRPGIQALKKVSAVKEVSCGAVGFRLAPRLNAAGRLEDAALGVELLLTDQPKQAEQLATMLDGFNRERQTIEQQTLEQAIEIVERQPSMEFYTLVLADDRWHSGVIGIVASRLVERYHCPVVMIALADGQGKGSARSIRNFHLYQALQGCESTLLGYGGHAMAAGLSIDQGQVEEFRRQIDDYARQTLSHQDLLPKLLYDGETELKTLTLKQVRELERLSPFGAGNPQPAFVSRQVEILSPKIVGATHLRFDVEQQGTRISCIAFGMADRINTLPAITDILYRVGINSWRGKDSVQLQISDFCAAKQKSMKE